MKKEKKRGFTLIELLVVIALIGILSSIVLASLSRSRSGGGSAAQKEQLVNMRVVAQLYFANAGGGTSYGAAGVTPGACTGVNAPPLMTATVQNNGLSALLGGVLASATLDCGVIAGTNPAWSVASQLQDGTYWCVDSTSASRGKTAAGVTYSGGVVNASGPHTAAGATVCQ
jgi:prepilin-type N-terminal cleavage/methylation domain-containing protein